MANRKRQQPN